MPQPKLSELEREELMGMIREGSRTFKEIGEKYGVSSGTLSYYANKIKGKRGPYKKRKIAPIVYRAEQNGTGHALDELFSSLSLESKIAALKAVIEGRS